MSCLLGGNSAPGKRVADVVLPGLHLYRVRAFRELIHKVRARFSEDGYSEARGHAATLRSARLNLHDDMRSMGFRSHPNVLRSMRRPIDSHNRPHRILLAVTFAKDRVCAKLNGFRKYRSRIPGLYPFPLTFRTEEGKRHIRTAGKRELSPPSDLLHLRFDRIYWIHRMPFHLLYLHCHVERSRNIPTCLSNLYSPPQSRTQPLHKSPDSQSHTCRAANAAESPSRTPQATATLRGSPSAESTSEHNPKSHPAPKASVRTPAYACAQSHAPHSAA